MTAADLIKLAAAEDGSIPAGLLFFDGGGDPEANPFAADLTEGLVIWPDAFDYLSIKAAGELYVFDSGSFVSLEHGVSNVALWKQGPPVPEPSAAIVFALGLGVVGAGWRRRTTASNR